MFGATIAAGFCSLAMGCASSWSAQQATFNRQTHRAEVALSSRDDADSLAAAALLDSPAHRDESLALIARATAAAPGRADLAWLQVQMCGSAKACDPEPFERRVRELDPSNGAGWLGALSRATVSHNEEAKDAALAAIGQSDRVDIYWTTLSAALSRAAVRTRTMSPADAQLTIIGLLSAQTIPAYGAVSKACKGESLNRPEIVDSCRGAATALERGDAIITEMMGVAIAERLWPEDSPQWKAAADARRLYDYRSQFWPAVDQWTRAHVEDYLALCAHIRREQDVLRAELIAAGKNADPPGG